MHLAYFIWNWCKKTGWRRFFAGLLIGGAFGLSASISVSHDTVTIVTFSVASAAIGGIASLLLESRDRRRESSPEWQHRVNKTEYEIQQANPRVPPIVARRVAVSRERERFTPLVWIGMAVGIFCALCGVVAFIMRIMKLLR